KPSQNIGHSSRFCPPSECPADIRDLLQSLYSICKMPISTPTRPPPISARRSILTKGLYSKVRCASSVGIPTFPPKPQAHLAHKLRRCDLNGRIAELQNCPGYQLNRQVIKTNEPVSMLRDRCMLATDPKG